MLAAMADARDAARGHEALLVSHQLPIWTARSIATGRRLWHDPRKRQCSLASLTSFTYDGDELVSVAYEEPAHDLLPVRVSKKFVAGA
jgi:broad specificity phosphatase PhoE